MLLNLVFWELPMKYSELLRKLKAQGAYFIGHRGRHDEWCYNGISVIIPRHKSQEVKAGTLKSIEDKLGLHLH